MTDALLFRTIRRQIDDLGHQDDSAGMIYRSLFERSHSIMLLIHPSNGDILDANRAACQFYGYKRDVLTGMKITDINTLSKDQVKAEMQRAKTEQTGFFTFRHRLHSGEQRDVEVYSSPIMIGGEAVLFSIIHDVTERKKQQKQREQLIKDREYLRAENQTLRGIIPICSYCKSIRDDDGYWRQLEQFINAHSDAKLSHGICPECMQVHFPDIKSPHGE